MGCPYIRKDLTSRGVSLQVMRSAFLYQHKRSFTFRNVASKRAFGLALFQGSHFPHLETVPSLCRLAHFTDRKVSETMSTFSIIRGVRGSPRLCGLTGGVAKPKSHGERQSSDQQTRLFTLTCRARTAFCHFLFVDSTVGDPQNFLLVQPILRRV